MSSTARRPTPCALDVVAYTVTDEHGPFCGHVQGVEQGLESLRVRLHVRQLAGVVPHVQQVEQAGLGEPSLVQIAGPVGVGQQARLEPPVLEDLQGLEGRGVMVDDAVPGAVIGRDRLLHRQMRGLRDGPDDVLGREHRLHRQPRTSATTSATASATATDREEPLRRSRISTVPSAARDLPTTT